MIKTVCALIALVCCACCSSPSPTEIEASSGGPAPTEHHGGDTDEVVAYRYPMMVSMSALHASRGMSAWYDTLYIPEYGVVCRVFGDYEEPSERVKGTWLEEPPRLYAAFRTMAEDRAFNPQHLAESRTAPVEVRLPRELAERILALARTKRRHDIDATEVAHGVLRQGVVSRPRGVQGPAIQ